MYVSPEQAIIIREWILEKTPTGWFVRLEVTHVGGEGTLINPEIWVALPTGKYERIPLESYIECFKLDRFTSYQHIHYETTTDLLLAVTEQPTSCLWFVAYESSVPGTELYFCVRPVPVVDRKQATRPEYEDSVIHLAPVGLDARELLDRLF